MLTSVIRTDTPAKPVTPLRQQREEHIVNQAIALLEQKLFTQSEALTSTKAASDYLQLKLLPEPNEMFSVIFLNAQHQVIAYETLFQGTIDGAAVYPRVIVQRALTLNAAALILAHQHPSGCTEPSQEDKKITSRIQDAVALVDIRVLDHFIIGKGEPFSFASDGLL